MLRHSHSTNEEARLGALPHRQFRPLAIALAITFTLMVVEVVGGVLTNSLVLLADAGHMAADVGALGLALFAMWVARRPHTATRTYGYLRVEVLAALLNGVTLWAIAGYIFWEAAQRFASVPDVQSGPMLAVATAGLAANLASGALLARASRDNLNIRGAFFHVLGDTLGSLGAILAGLFMLTLGWFLVDPIISVVIGLIILVGSYRLVRDAMNVLLEGSPPHVDPVDLQRFIEAFPLVKGVHDIHTWTITSGYHAMSAHVLLGVDCGAAQAQVLLKELRRTIALRYDINHITIQLEGGDEECQESHLPPSPEVTGVPDGARRGIRR